MREEETASSERDRDGRVEGSNGLEKAMNWGAGIVEWEMEWAPGRKSESKSRKEVGSTEPVEGKEESSSDD